MMSRPTIIAAGLLGHVSSAAVSMPTAISLRRASAISPCSVSGGIVLGGKQFRLVMGHQRLDHLLKRRSLDDLVKLAAPAAVLLQVDGGGGAQRNRHQEGDQHHPQ